MKGEKLIALVKRAITDWEHGDVSERISDHLIANGVTIPVRCRECCSYNESSEYCGFWGESRHPEHFCDEGERRK